MLIEDSDLDAAVAAGLLDPTLRADLVAFAAKRRQAASNSPREIAAPAPRFDPVHVLYYAGALVVIGAMTLWGAVSWGNGDEFDKAVYCAFNIAFIALGLFLGRRVYAVFGTIGISLYLGHLAFDVFNDVIGFSFALTAIGVAIIFAGVYLERRRGAINAYFDAHLPAFVRLLRPLRAQQA